MRSDPGAVRPPIATMLLAFAASTAVADGFTVGEAVPEFAFETPDGTAVEFRPDDGRAVVVLGEERIEPEAMMIHFFQPDCFQCRAQMKALEGIHEDFRERGVVVLGIAHRGDTEAVREVREDLDLSFPLAMGIGSDVAKALSAGDAMALVDADGVVRFTQAGYRPAHGGEPGDEALWRENITRILNGRPIEKTTVNRERLQAGDLMPAVALDELFTDEPMLLAGEEGKLTFRNTDGEVTHPKAAVGFFSRYWAFSREEMVHLQRLYEKYRDDGLLAFTIAMAPERDVAERITRKLDVTFPIFWGTGSELGEQFAFGWPAYIIDAGGVIKYTQVGFEAEDAKKYESVIRDILGIENDDSDDGENGGE